MKHQLNCIKWVLIKGLLIKGVFVYFVLTVNCQPRLFFDRIGVEDGLVDVRVKSIYQDKKGFIWLGSNSGLSRYDGLRFKNYTSHASALNLNIPVYVSQIFEDHQGHMWLLGGTKDKWRTLFKYNPELDTFAIFDLSDYRVTTAYVTENNQFLVGGSKGLFLFDPPTGICTSFIDKFSLDITHAEVSAITEDSFGNLWFAYPNGLYRFSWEGKVLSFFPLPNAVIEIFEDSRKKLWIGSTPGLYYFDPENEEIILYPLVEVLNGEQPVVMTISESLDGKLWIGAPSVGLFLMDSSTEQISFYKSRKNMPGALAGDIIVKIYKDTQDGMWIGTNDSDLLYWNPYRKPFISYRVDAPGNNRISGSMVRSLSEGKDGKIWFSTEDGLELFNPQIDAFSFKAVHFAGADADIDLNGVVWMGSYSLGLMRFDPHTNQRDYYEINDFKFVQLIRRHYPITEIYIDQKNVLWFYSPSSGLSTYDIGLDLIEPKILIHPEKKDTLRQDVRCIFTDKNNYLWIGNRKYLIKLDSNEKVQQVYNIPYVEQIYEDQDGLWMASSSSGLYHLSFESERIQNWRQKDGLPHNTIFSIQGDNKGRLWLGTFSGLSCFSPQNKEFRTYSISDGLPGSKFSDGASIKTQSGELYFGLTGGILRFYPDSIYDNPQIPSVVITDFKIGTQSMPIKGSLEDTMDISSPIQKSISYVHEMSLKWNQNDISFEFAALNYLQPEKNHYKYRLEPYEQKWIETNATRPFANYTNLDPGKYTFRVIGANNDEIWNEVGASIKVIVHPPWWASTWAYILYSLVFVSILYSLYRFQLNRQLAAQETRRLKELDHFKTRFFTNITHEFRTPLTVIMGVAKQLTGNLQKKQLIQRNSQRLLQLINQLLDLSKLEAGQLSLQPIQQDVIPFLKYLTESFHSLAEEKNIQLTFYSEVLELIMDYDPEKLQQIATNLLSNAMKYTSAGGKVIVHAKTEKNQLFLKVQDTGTGISPDALSNIFDRFYQVDDSATRQAEGTGIGLALTKELVELMNGTIEVESQVRQGSTFIVMLPITHIAPIQETAIPVASIIDKSISEPVTHTPLSEDAPIALIIEDNKDVGTYLQSCLQTDYQIEVAYDGEAGVEKAIEIVPDIIISDVMMPKKDGYEVCQTLKEDQRTSHIPIVILTAKATQEDKLKGLKRGADAFLMKPFDPVELEVRLQKLLEVRKQLKARYQSGELAQSPTFQQEDEFLQKLRAVVEESMGEETFGVEALAHKMKLSRVQVHRKLKALTDQPTTHFIRAIRMKRAVELLKTTDLQIAEVAYKVGYSDPSYFTRQFVQVYRKRPSELRE